jgi:predicted transcriptional regulator
MKITFEEIRHLKDLLPCGSFSRIARELGIHEQRVRNFFGANKSEEGALIGRSLQPNTNGGIINLEDTAILNLAKQIIAETAAGAYRYAG